MKYDQAWLKRVNATKQLIEKVEAVVDRIPQIQDRATVLEAFRATEARFLVELKDGRDTAYTAGKIEELNRLAHHLVNPPPFAHVKDAE